MSDAPLADAIHSAQVGAPPFVVAPAGWTLTKFPADVPTLTSAHWEFSSPDGVRISLGRPRGRSKWRVLTTARTKGQSEWSRGIWKLQTNTRRHLIDGVVAAYAKAHPETVSARAGRREPLSK